MRIVIATGIYPPDIGGPATYSQLIGREFSKRGNKVVVICYSDKEQRRMNKEQFRVVRILRKHRKSIRHFLYFWNLLKLAWSYDIIYGQGSASSGLPALLVSKILKKKFLFRLGGDNIWEKAIEQEKTWLPLCQYYKSGLFKKQGIIFKIFTWVLKSTDLVIFSTKFQRDICLRYAGLRKKKTIIIKNAFPDLRNMTRLPSFSEQILFAGRLIKVKNLKLLIKIFSEVFSEANKNIQLRIIGDGPEKKKLQDLVKELHLEKNIIFENRTSQQESLERIRRCYFVVLPSLTEISPNLVLECIKLNKPILLTQNTGFYEDFKEDLLFFNPCDKEDFLKKFKWLLEEQNYKEYQEKMKKINTKRSWSELAREHLLIFRNLK